MKQSFTEHKVKNHQPLMAPDSLMAFERGDVSIPHEISNATKGMTMKFLPLVGTCIEAQNQKDILTYLA